MEDRSRRPVNLGGLEEAKEYMTERDIPQLFESMMTALMYRKPMDHLDFLQSCIDKAKDEQRVHWHSFIDPLPPIPKSDGTILSENLGHISSNTESKSPIPTQTAPLPSIQTKTVDSQSFNKGLLEEYASRTVDMSSVLGKPIVFVLGGPGSGKGTQCAKIVDQYNFTHLSAGDLLRAEVAKGTPIGSKLDEVMKEGQLVPQSVTICLIKEAMVLNSATSGFLIDGFPREIKQGIQFEKECGLATRLLYYTCPDEILTARLLARAAHSGRIDDNEETIKKRLKLFHEKTQPVVEYYENITIEVDADRTVEEVFATTCQGLDEMLRVTSEVASRVNTVNEGISTVSNTLRKPRDEVSEEPCVVTEEVATGGDEGNRDYSREILSGEQKEADASEDQVTEEEQSMLDEALKGMEG